MTGKKNYIQFDVMASERYVCTLRYPYEPLFKVDFSDMLKFALEKRPTLRNKKGIELWIDENPQPMPIGRYV